MMVTKNLTIEVSDDFNNDWFLKASPQDKTEIINIGTNILKEIKHKILTHYKNSSDRQTDIDNLIKIETDIITEKCKDNLIEFQTKCSKLEGENEILHCKVDHMEPQLNLLKKDLFDKDNSIYDEKQMYKKQIRNEYESEIQKLNDIVNKLHHDREHNNIAHQNREDSIRNSCEEKIDLIREKYENMNNIYHNSSKKGKSGEIHAHNVLVSILPTATITDTNKQTASGDCHISYNGVNIFYENKNYESSHSGRAEKTVSH